MQTAERNIEGDDTQEIAANTAADPTPEASKRFAFGQNWLNFSETLPSHAHKAARESLQMYLGCDSLTGLRFLDVGCGSGIFSLAARELGAEVESFDYDVSSVECTATCRDKYRPNDPAWRVQQGSVLDSEFLKALGGFDVVYSWGVLHHTGSMWQAMENVRRLVKPGGKLFIALYNDQGWISRYWMVVKRVFNANSVGKYAMIALHAPYLLGLRYLTRLVTGRLKDVRGMRLWNDMFDWLGGYPFEVAKAEQVLDFYLPEFELVKLSTCGGRHGCNQFVFAKEKIE